MNWGLIIDPTVKKKLKKIQRKDAERLFQSIELLPENPYAGDVEKMEGEKDVWRRRIGNYRIFYEIRQNEKVINVYDIHRRTSTTYSRR